VRGYNNLGAALADSGRGEEAIAVLSKALSVKPDHAEAYYNLGRVYLLFTDRTDKAIEMLRWAIGLNPDYTDAYINLAAAYNKDRRFADTTALLENALISFKDRPEAHFNLGVAYVYLRNTEGAARELGTLRDLDPGLAGELERFITSVEAR
jgi:tetratricopeptide (TPR) repeat protein